MTAVTTDVGSNFIRGLHDACEKQDVAVAHVLRMQDEEREERVQYRLTHLRVALRSASIAARDFAVSDEPLDQAQRERYMTLADTLEAQERSLRAEV
jgi:hypothetical protein